MKNDTQNFIDIEPLHITLGKNEWVHPDIEQIVGWEKPDWCEDSTELWSVKPVHRVYITNKKKNNTAYIVFYSDWLNQRESVNVSDTLLNQTFEFSEEEADNFMLSLATVLHEDVWFPGNAQFCMTPMYRKIQREIGMRWQVTFLSPDVALHKDGNEVSWSS